MTSPTTADLSQLAPADLLARLTALVAHSHELTATMLAHIAEVDARRLYLDAACPSMFVYLTTRLHFSEAVAYKHLGAARAARAFPVITEMVARGEVHLCAVILLAPHLTAANHAQLLAQAVHRSKREVDELVAARFPASDVPARMRKLPGPRASARVPTPSLPVHGAPPVPGPTVAPLPPPLAAPPARPAARPPAPPAVVAPLTADRYKIQLTVDRTTRDKLRAAQDLLRHRVPDGDLAKVLDRALDALLRDLRRARFAATPQPRASAPVAAAPSAGAPTSRHIPAAIRRAVVARDGEQCTFVDDTGQRCPARGRLEFHHCEPFALGGRHDVDQITLRCAAHNAHAARRDFGTAHIERCVAATSGAGVSPRGESPPTPAAGPS